MTPRPDSGRFSLVAVMTSAQRSRLRRRGISDDFTFSTRAFNIRFGRLRRRSGRLSRRFALGAEERAGEQVGFSCSRFELGLDQSLGLTGSETDRVVDDCSRPS
jgi:hypothetical protein